MSQENEFLWRWFQTTLNNPNVFLIIKFLTLYATEWMDLSVEPLIDCFILIVLCTSINAEWQFYFAHFVQISQIHVAEFAKLFLAA